jgi:hypothetical protein
MQCPDCGAHFVKEDEFCGECGRKLSWETAGDSVETKAWAPDPDRLEDLAADLFEPPPPEPTKVETKPKKSNPRTIAIVVGLALLVLCLCVSGALVWLITSEESAVEPTRVMPEPGMLLYQQLFDGPDDGWSTFDGDGTAVGYVDGGYRMTINRIEYMVWGNPEPLLDLADLMIEVDVRQVEGPLDNNFGVLVRYLEDDEQESYYWFQISGDGFYSVDLRWEDEWIPLVEWEASTAIYTGLGVTNRIRVVCAGDQFSFYANNDHLVDVSDGTIGRGSIGLAAGTFEESGVVAQFDNLWVYELGE